MSASEFEELKLADFSTYLMHGVHIGTRQKTGCMRKYVYRVRPDGLYIIDVRKTDLRIQVAAKFISRFDSQKVIAVSARQYAQFPVQKFGEVTGIRTMVGRFIPGTFTNPRYPGFLEPDLLIISDPLADEQPLAEAAQVGIPTVGLCDSDNEITNIDLVIPTNNKGRKALAFVFWLLARQVLMERGELTPEKPFELTPQDFEPKPGGV